MEGAFGQVMTNDPDLSGRNEPSTETAQGIFAVAARGNHRWLPGLSAHGDDYPVEEANADLAPRAGQGPRQGKLGPPQSGTRRSRRALAITETELKVIAALASMGLSSQPRKG